MRVSNHDVLIVVDVQNDFCSGGAPAVPGGEKVVPAINCIAQKFQNVVLTQDWHPQDHVSFASNHAHKHPYDTVELSYGSQVLWPDHCVQGSAGAEFHRSLDTARAGLCAAQGNRSRDRLLFRALRKRPQNADGSGRLCPRTRVDDIVLRRTGIRLLRPVCTENPIRVYRMIESAKLAR